MISSFNIHNIKISLKLQTPGSFYFLKKVEQLTNLKYKHFSNFLVIYSKYTYIFFKTANHVVHCNITKINKYGEIYKAKQNLKKLFPETLILSTRVDNICATRKAFKPINLDYLFKKIAQNDVSEYRVNYNTQKFPGLFIKFSGSPITGTLIIFRSGAINCLGIKNPRQFLEVDEWINEWVYNV